MVIRRLTLRPALGRKLTDDPTPLRAIYSSLGTLLRLAAWERVFQAGRLTVTVWGGRLALTPAARRRLRPLPPGAHCGFHQATIKILHVGSRRGCGRYELWA